MVQYNADLLLSKIHHEIVAEFASIGDLLDSCFVEHVPQTQTTCLHPALPYACCYLHLPLAVTETCYPHFIFQIPLQVFFCCPLLLWPYVDQCSTCLAMMSSLLLSVHVQASSIFFSLGSRLVFQFHFLLLRLQVSFLYISLLAVLSGQCVCLQS